MKTGRALYHKDRKVKTSKRQKDILMLPTQGIRAIIFDHDGTLVDSESIHCECWNRVLAQHNARLTFDDYCNNYNGLPTRDTAAAIRQKFDLPLSHEELYQCKIEQLNHFLSRAPFPLLPAVQETLDWLYRKQVPMAIASGANRNEVNHSIKAHQLSRFFPVATTKQDVSNSKPAPDVYLLAAQQLGILPENCLAIEDSDTGYRSALAAGMGCLRLTPNPSLAYEFSHMADIAHWLRKHMK